jgi:hypothetical protein
MCFSSGVSSTEIAEFCPTLRLIYGMSRKRISKLKRTFYELVEIAWEFYKMLIEVLNDANFTENSHVCCLNGMMME